MTSVLVFRKPLVVPVGTENSRYKHTPSSPLIQKGTFKGRRHKPVGEPKRESEGPRSSMRNDNDNDTKTRQGPLESARMEADSTGKYGSQTGGETDSRGPTRDRRAMAYTLPSNSIDTTIMCDLFKHYPDLQSWMKVFLAAMSFQIRTDRVIGETKMTGGTLQGSPLSQSLFTIYMSAMVRRVEELDEERQHRKLNAHNLRRRDRPLRSFQSLQFIDDCNSVVNGDVKDMDLALECSQGIQAGMGPYERREERRAPGGEFKQEKHLRFRETKAHAAFQLIRRLARLLRREKKKIVMS